MEERENGRNEIFSRTVKAGRRTYFIAVKEASNKDKYITLTETKRVDKDKFDRFSIMVFQDTIDDFVDALQEVCEKVG